MKLKKKLITKIKEIKNKDRKTLYKSKVFPSHSEILKSLVFFFNLMTGFCPRGCVWECLCLCFQVFLKSAFSLKKHQTDVFFSVL
jgi:hypothetical protein